MTASPPAPRKGLDGRLRLGTIALVVSLLLAASLVVSPKVAAVSVTVAYSSVPVADGDLDGLPGTGDWTGATSVSIPLENGEAGGYGTATFYLKHDGTFFYFRLDGQVDVPWTSATGNHFWLGYVISPTGTSHHGAGTWDGAFFGLWDGTDYTPMPTYPPPVVDTNGFDRPPLKDASQDLLGRMGYAGGSAPYSYTAEWKGRLNSGDASDLTYVADGTTSYNFFVTTDSNGGGSSGGNIRHRQVTNVNTMRFASVPGNTPPTADLTDPDGGEDWTGGTAHTIFWNMSDAETPTTSLLVWLNYSTNGGGSYSPIPGAQGASGFSSPASFAWTVPLTDTTQARVRLVVADSAGATAVDASAADFTIDSTAPTVSAVDPADGATNVPLSTWVNLTFGEAMNAGATEGATTLRELPGWSPVPFVVQGWVGNTLRISPSAPLLGGTVYAVNVSSAARDDSSPGNALVPHSSQFTTLVPATSPPVATLLAPAGLQDWTGGSPHNVVWTMTDAQTPVSGLTAWLNYSYAGGTQSGPIAGPIPGSANPHTFSWAVPSVDATDMAVNLTVLDGEGLLGYDEALVPIVDATSPSVASVSPSPGSSGIPVDTWINLTFDEGMAPAATEGAASLLELPLWTSVPLTVQGWVGNTLRLAPAAPLQSRTTYAVNVSSAARDDSDPGNPLAAFSSEFTTVDRPPSVAVTSPAGGEVWTGGSTHAVAWTASDPDTPPALLNVSLFYSLTGAAPWTTIATGLSGTSGNTPWVLPTANSSATAVRARVEDDGGNFAEVVTPPFTVDATPPTIASRTPAPGQSGVPRGANVLVTFSEAMDTASPTWFGLQSTADLSWVVGVSTWDMADRRLTFNPTGLLDPGVTYRAFVNASAEDASDPGNPLGTDVTWTFTTSTGSDTTPPEFANVGALPDPVAVGQPVNVSADVTDDVGLSFVTIAVSLGPTEVRNTSMTQGSADRWYDVAGFATPGTYAFRITAEDTSGNRNATSGQFVVRDATPPVISGEAAVPPTQLPGGSVNVSAMVTDAFLVGVFVEIRLPSGSLLGNFTAGFDAASGRYYHAATYGTPGTYSFRILAVDVGDNWAQATGTFEILDTVAPTVSSVTALPALQSARSPVNVSAVVTDDALAGVWIEVYLPGGALLGNFTATFDAGTGRHFHRATFGTHGVHTVRVVAVDVAGNWAVGTGSFEIDAVPPSITDASGLPSPQALGGAVNVSALVADDHLGGVWIEVYLPGGALLGNFTANFDPGTGRYYHEATYGLSGQHTYRVVALDLVGNWAVAPGTFDLQDLEPPIADAGPDRTVPVGSTVTFDGTASTDNVGIANYTWAFRYGGAPVALYGPVTSFTFAIPGDYLVVLTVTDDGGLAASDGTSVRVLPDAPPPAPGNVRATPREECIDVTWSAVIADDLAGYRVYRWSEEAGAFLLLVGVDAATLSVEDCGLFAGTHLYYVTAHDDPGGESPPSEIASATIPLPSASASGVGEALLILGLVAAAVLGAAFLLWWRRRRGDSGETEASEGPSDGDSPPGA